jgi:hypothetical protein
MLTVRSVVVTYKQSQGIRPLRELIDKYLTQEVRIVTEMFFKHSFERFGPRTRLGEYLTAFFLLCSVSLIPLAARFTDADDALRELARGNLLALH